MSRTIAATSRPDRRDGNEPSAPSFGTRLAVDADIRPRDRLEPLDRDLASRVRADAVRALLHPDQRGVDLVPAPRYDLLAAAVGAAGERVEKPDEVLKALRRGLERVRSGQSAVVDVILARP